MSLIKKLINKPTQTVRLFANTTKRDGSALDEVNHNLRGTFGEHTLSMYPNRETSYLEVSRPCYEGSKIWIKGYISLSFHGERMEGEVQVNVGVLTLPDGRELKVELRDCESHAKRQDSSDTYQAYTLVIFGGSLSNDSLEAAIRRSQDRKASSTNYKAEEPEEVLPTPTEGTISKKTGEVVPPF